MAENIEEIKNRLEECEKRVEELSNKCESVENQRNFEYLNSRIHTRESSTLVFSTVTVSASLVLLGILIGLENPFVILPPIYSILLNVPDSLGTMYLIYENFLNSNNWLFWVGVIPIIIGIFYREITIHYTDKKDYDALDDFDVSRYYSRTYSGIVRGGIVQVFFFMALDAWWLYKGLQILDSVLDPGRYLLYLYPWSHILTLYPWPYNWLLIHYVIFPAFFLWLLIKAGFICRENREKYQFLNPLNEEQLKTIAKKRGIKIEDDWTNEIIIKAIASRLSVNQIRQSFAHLQELHR